MRVQSFLNSYLNRIMHHLQRFCSRPVSGHSGEEGRGEVETDRGEEGRGEVETDRGEEGRER